MNSVIKGVGYVLVHTPDMVLHNGTTQTTERIVNPDSKYLKELKNHLRTYEEAVGYWPNQVYVGANHPDDLREIAFPYFDKKKTDASRYGAFGEIMPQEEFLFLIKACDMFEVVKLEEEFVKSNREAFVDHPILDEEITARITEGIALVDIKELVEQNNAEPLYHNHKLVGCIKAAHDLDTNLSAHVMHENLVSKASSVLALLYAVKNAGISKTDVEYVIDCAEEACGDMNQRGGGNFAKAAAEMAGLANATGSDTRGFCAAPVHALVEAAALVKAGAYKTVVVTSGGCTAKLGMNGKDHIKKEVPILEDCLGGFAIVITENDGVNPEINLDIIGRHAVGTGSSPQAVIGSLVQAPLKRAGYKILDIDKFSVEMQNPDITKPAGAGDVPLANYKMIGALAAKSGEMTPKDLSSFVENHGLIGWAPTQGHIPSGVPYVGFATKDILEEKINTAMIIGKGSLFLGRMTNLFDGVSFVLQANTKKEGQNRTLEQAVSMKKRIAVTGLGSELGEEAIMQGAMLATQKGVEVCYIGTLEGEGVETIYAEDEEDGHNKMEELLKKKKVDGVVTMHYPFPVGVATVGKAIAPGTGKEIYIATTTGTTSTERVEAMVRNAISGVIAAKACGVKNPTIGILNVEGARACETALKELVGKGYELTFARSGRADGGCIMRGNDILQGSADVLVCDSLSGNIILKMISSFTTGGTCETAGYGYGPGIGEHYDPMIMIVSRASGSPVIAGAIEYAATLKTGNLREIAKREFEQANGAGLAEVVKKREPKQEQETVEMPQKEVVTAQISGVEIMDLDDGVQVLWKEGLYAESGMGCTGPIILVAEANIERATELLKLNGFL